MQKQNQTKQTVVLPIRLSETTYGKLKQFAESLGVKPSIYIKSLLINDIKNADTRYRTVDSLLDSLPINKMSEKEVMKKANKTIKTYRKK